MKVVGIYSFKNGRQVMEQQYPNELKEIYEGIGLIDASQHKTKESKEMRKSYGMLYAPISLNSAFKIVFTKKGWSPKREICVYPTNYYVPGYKPRKVGKGTNRTMDFVKNKVGIEIQFGKYSFMVYNVAAKMTIFHNLGYIDVGVEIVPVLEFQSEMSSGVSYFEQFTWDLDKRGSADIDIPVLVLGITK